MMKKVSVAVLVFLAMTVVSFAGEGSENLLTMVSVGPRTEAVDVSAYRQVTHVSITKGSDEKGDGSREKPWKTLHHALDETSDAASENRYAVLVSEGVYAQYTLTMKPYVDLFGGFCPETWKRDIFQHRAVLDGEGVRRVVLGADQSRIDGFVIANGLARYHGGGILCLDASPMISNNVIIDNMVLEQEDFDHHHIHQDGQHGGGIAVLYNSVPVIKNNVIAGNRTSAGMGAGIAFYGLLRMEGAGTEIVDNFMTGGVQAVCENNVIIGNRTGANDLNRTRSSSGGGIACAQEARPFIRNNVIAMNSAEGRSDAGGVYVEFYSYPVIEGNWIIGNVSDDDGGGIYVMRLSQPLIRENIIAGNWTRGNGCGGIRVSKEGRARIIDNRIVHNLTGSGVQCVDSYMEFMGNIVMDQPKGPGLIYKTLFSYFQPSVARDNVIRRNGGGSLHVSGTNLIPLIVEECNVEGGFEGEGNLDEDPGFGDDGLSGMSRSMQLDSEHMITVLVPKKSLKNSTGLSGRVIHVGDCWSVIKETSDKEIIVWGNITTNTGIEIDFEVIPRYER